MNLVKRALNEAPTVAVVVATILGLDASDAAAWQEAAASLAALGTWFVVRYSSDGPVTIVEREKRVRQAMKGVRERRKQPDPAFEPEPNEDAVAHLIKTGYSEQIARRAIGKQLRGEELTPQEASCVQHVQRAGIALHG